MRRTSRIKNKKLESTSDGEEDIGGSASEECRSKNDTEAANITGKKRNGRGYVKNNDENNVDNKEDTELENGKPLTKKKKKYDENSDEKVVSDEEIDKILIKNKKGNQDQDIEVNEEIIETEENEKSIGKTKRKNKVTKKEENNSDNVEYEVEKIVDQRTIKGRRQFLVRWKGYTEESDTWEQETELKCDRLIEEFLAEQEENNECVGKEEKNEKDEKKIKIKKHDKKFKAQKKISKGKKEGPKDIEKNNDTEDDVDDTKEYEVEKIIEVHFRKDKAREFLIRWKGFSSTADTWEPEDHLNCPELINKFMEKLQKMKNTESRELRVNPSHTKRYTLTMHGDKRQSRRNADKQRVTYHECD